MQITVTIQMREVVWSRPIGGKKWSDSRYIIMIKLREFADKLYFECKKKQRVKDYSKFWLAQ